ncbi:MAG: MOSC domain-containing protein [Rhodospirillaceae bacterium]|nr:MOSC domain-containing protein [Rhodospirillaceae bacterium]
MQWQGRLDHIHITPAASQPMQALTAVKLVAGRGIERDRYMLGTGTYSPRPDIREATLIESEALEALERDYGVSLLPHEHRRNLTTTGVPLNHLVGKRFAVGDCVLEGGRLNVPCEYLQDLLKKKVFKPLIHRSGLNCRIIVGGIVRVGDTIRPA